MAKYDHGGGCGCGLEKECPPDCEWYRSSGHEKGYDAVKEAFREARKILSKRNISIQKENKMSLRDKLIKNSTLEHTSMLSESKIYSKKDMIPTPIPMINVALSGSLDGGITPGVTMLAGPSKHFKTGFALLLASAFLRKYKDGLILFYDSEFGTPQGYFDTFGIPHDAVIHSPVTDVEELKHDLSVQLRELGRDDKVFVVIDSIGNLASKKETEDAIEGKTVADMTRAKALKSFFRIVTAKLTLKDIPMVVINHTYDSLGMFPSKVVSGGCIVAGTMIQTPEGPRPIENIKEGEVVNTAYGTNTVLHTWNPETLEEGHPLCYEIEFEDGYKVICSENHKFLVDGIWIEAKNLEAGVYCAKV